MRDLLLQISSRCCCILYSLCQTIYFNLRHDINTRQR